jgi:hypothetical protein
MPQMNLYPSKWDLDEAQCPCDLHFNDWLDERGLTGRSIYHFGTGTHHAVGKRQAENGSGNAVFGITASEQEYAAYIALVREWPRIAKSYVAYFGDIYLTEPRLLPAFDIITLFHLCEFSHPSTTTDEYGGLTDLSLLVALTDKLRPGGFVLFYTGSYAFDATQIAIAAWERAAGVHPIGEYKSLLVYEKRA